MSKQQFGWKFLDPLGQTWHNNKPFAYNLPRPGEKWSEPTLAPNPITEDDGKNCGAGRLHLMRKPTNPHGQHNSGWWVWYAKAEGLVTRGDQEKIGATQVRLRRVQPEVFHRIIRLGWCESANLGYANLRRANLRRANLSGASLYNADLGYANLGYANLYDAYLYDADLSYANLYDADLSYANLRGASLRGADLRGAILLGANLRRAILRGADLRGADLRGAILLGANLRGADLIEAKWNTHTIWPIGLTPPERDNE